MRAPAPKAAAARATIVPIDETTSVRVCSRRAPWKSCILSSKPVHALLEPVHALLEPVHALLETTDACAEPPAEGIEIGLRCEAVRLVGR